MRKIRLEPDTLKVESFAPAARVTGLRGTVNANEPETRTCPPNSFFPTQCYTDCDCTLGCPSIAPCTELLF